LFAPGIKIWSNGLATKLDLYQSCDNFCRYCYAKEMRDMTLNRNGILQNQQVARVVDMKALITFFNKALRGEETSMPFVAWAIREKKFIELGTTGETFQRADNHFHLADTFLNLTSDLEIPLFINTKFNLLCTDDRYQKLLINHKAPILIQPTFTTTDDKLGKLYEPLAPLPSERLKLIRELSKYEHIKFAAYISPFMPGITDIDTEKFICDLVDVGIVGAHLRDFYIQGQTFQTPFWVEYRKKNSGALEPFPGGYHVKTSVKMEFIEKAQKIAVKRNPYFRIVGMKTKLFDLDTHYGKMVYDILPEKFKDGIVEFTIIPLLRAIKKHKDIPQLLYWDKIGYDKTKIKYPPLIRTNEGDINNLMDWGCNCNKSEVEMKIEGYDWINHGIWNGFEKHPSGFINEMEGIYPVKDNGEYVSIDGNWVYCYVPKGFERLLKSSAKQMALFTPTPSELENPYVDLNDTKDMYIPERPKDASDRWLTKEELLNELS
jgi:DNA repair photolyase